MATVNTVVCCQFLTNTRYILLYNVCVCLTDAFQSIAVFTHITTRNIETDCQCFDLVQTAFTLIIKDIFILLSINRYNKESQNFK